MKQIIDNILNYAKMNKLMELAAIWIDSKVMVETSESERKYTLRLEKGQHIRVVSGTILDVRDNAPANYTIESLYGDLYSTMLEAHLISNSGEILKLILK